MCRRPGTAPWPEHGRTNANAPVMGRWRFCFCAVSVMYCALVHYRFRLYAELLSLCLRERESNQRESAPGIRVSLRETSLASALFRGSSRWAIPGPSFLVWHPCQTSLYTAPALGLLTGPGDRGACEICGSDLDREIFCLWRQCSPPLQRAAGARSVVA